MDILSTLIGIFIGTFVGFFMYAIQARKFSDFENSLLLEWWLVIKFVFTSF